MEISKVKGEKGGCVETDGCVEVSPNVRKSAELRAMNQKHVEVFLDELYQTTES